MSTESPPSPSRTPSRARTAVWFAWLAACAALYLVVELEYVERLPLITDELDGAYDVYRLRTEIPYLDFKPYKTVLGYYVQLPALLSAPDVWTGLMRVKLELTIMNTVLLALAAWQVGRIFSRLAAGALLPAWVLMTEWLERSSELRVDTLTAWPGLFSLLALLQGHAALAGMLAGLSFLVSQKGAYYIAAAGAALAVRAVLALRNTAPGVRAASQRELLRFGVACALALAPYFLAFSLATSLEATTRATFLSHHAIALTDIYPNIRKFWRATLIRNPAFYALGLLGLAALASRVLRASHDAAPARARTDRLLLVFGTVLAALCIWHKQPWPYFFVLLIPFVYVLGVAGVHTLEPALLGTTASTAQRWLSRVGVALVLASALAFPIARIPTILRESNGYQDHMVELAHRLLAPDERYIAAMDVLYDRKQASDRLRRVSVARRRELSRLSAAQVEVMVDALRQRPPKLLIRNERFTAFPAPVKRFFAQQYAPYWGSIELYAPKLPRGARTVEIAFTGSYRVNVPTARTLTIDGRKLRDDEVVSLDRGPHAMNAPHNARLYLRAPEVDPLRDARYERRREFMGNAYNR